MGETALFIFIGLGVLVASIVAFDVYIIRKKGKPASISAYIIRGHKKYPMPFILLASAFSFTMGHLFWSMDSFDVYHKEELIKKCEALKD